MASRVLNAKTRGEAAARVGAFAAEGIEVERRAALIEEFKSRLGAVRAAEHFGIDDVIDPRDTRRLIIETLQVTPARRRLALPPKHRSIAPI